ncbi:hypothetical protein KKI90_22850 [Xenorhabdus bovienii]|uniref:hypothetical protein n=1 Tax=Xenorhabdus bovienii TaxID=40576 RepID=UPI00237D1C56|nr:hypothetical protein [Xenorhabdus bovienii]MDE1489063.1 hypothetical protein [Xenorhabdus bovienii]MDE9473759.1 hypothetical protein [Xenorhabdus bovienii]MDE9479947.1 hypothetical protein [Xenorhabdus bovienii]MDE9532883.1 hypothetical protein [Xenorhabdus bovienii]
MYVLSKVFTPISYLRIKHPEKRYFDFILPVITSLILISIIGLLPKTIAIIGKDSLISLVNGILQILSGFYIASMAAVSTFQKKGMDDVMRGSAPTLRDEELTRRKFLAYLFGYLAFMSIAMYFVGGATQLMHSSIKEMSLLSLPFMKNFLLFIYLIAICNIIYTTTLGMFFMIDKMHDEEPELKTNNGNNE